MDDKNVKAVESTWNAPPDATLKRAVELLIKLAQFCIPGTIKQPILFVAQILQPGPCAKHAKSLFVT